MQSWALAVCATMIGGALFSLLVPNNNLKRVVQFTLSLFFVSALVAPFLTELPDVDFSFAEQVLASNDELEGVMETEVIKQAQSSLEQGLMVVFEQNGYKIEDITININSEEETTQITVVIPQEEIQRIPQMEQLVQNETGIIPKIVCQS